MAEQRESAADAALLRIYDDFRQCGFCVFGGRRPIDARCIEAVSPLCCAAGGGQILSAGGIFRSRAIFLHAPKYPCRGAPAGWLFHSSDRPRIARSDTGTHRACIFMAFPGRIFRTWIRILRHGREYTCGMGFFGGGQQQGARYRCGNKSCVPAPRTGICGSFCHDPVFLRRTKNTGLGLPYRKHRITKACSVARICTNRHQQNIQQSRRVIRSCKHKTTAFVRFLPEGRKKRCPVSPFRQAHTSFAQTADSGSRSAFRFRRIWYSAISIRLVPCRSLCRI